jgi:hypothetical protein
MSVSGVVLNNQDRTDAALLASNNRRKIRIKYVASFYCAVHVLHTPKNHSLRYRIGFLM